MENMSLIKDLVLVFAAMITAGSAAVTACAARKGINKWLVEITGRTNFEVAHGLMLATYKLRDAVRSCRLRLVRGKEFPDNYPLFNATPEQELDAWTYVFKNRWTPLWEASQDYNARAVEAEALWGSQIRKSTDKIVVQINTLSFSIDDYLQAKCNQGEFLADKTFEEEIESTVFAKNPEGDKLSKSIDEVIEEIRKWGRILVADDGSQNPLVLSPRAFSVPDSRCRRPSAAHRPRPPT